MLDKEFLYCYNGVKERKVIKMNSKELVRKLIEEKGVSQADVAATMNITPAALWDRISSKKTSSLSVKKLNEILRALGYEIVIMPRAKAGKIENAYVVEE
jgi:predicted transcriptional regulator